ncbi:MAG TPA: YlbF family regulator [Thermodesulfobacteriota bacterium]
MSETRRFNLVKEFAISVGDSTQFRRYEEAMNQIRNDKNAWRMLTEYDKKLQSYQMISLWNGASSDDLKVIEQVRVELLSNPTLREYFQAQEELLHMLRELNALISRRLGFDFASMMQSGGGCC